MDHGQIKESMRNYYDARAPEYDELFTDGRGPASISSPSAYKRDVAGVSTVVAELVHGDVLDLACGTGFWLQFYHLNSKSLTLIDQSPAMIAETRSRVRLLGLESKTHTILADVLNHDFGDSRFDCVFAGFLMSHLNDYEEACLFGLTKLLLREGGRFVILDSVWSTERAKTREKVGTQTRYLNDGREFLIFKRYFERSDFRALGERHGLQLGVDYFGKTLAAASATSSAGTSR